MQRALIFIIVVFGFMACWKTVTFAGEVHAEELDLAGYMEAIELRVSQLETALKEVSDSIAQEARDTMAFYRQAGKVMRRSNSRIDLLELELSILKEMEPVVARLQAEVEQLMADVAKLKRKPMVAEGKRESGIPDIVKRPERRPPDSFSARSRAPLSGGSYNSVRRSYIWRPGAGDGDGIRFKNRGGIGRGIVTAAALSLWAYCASRCLQL